MKLLKSDLLGTVWQEEERGLSVTIRDASAATWWLRGIARWLCRREVRALDRLDGLPGTPRLIASDRQGLRRQWIEGRPMQVAKPRHADYYRAARRLVSAMHRRGVVHCDLAKEPNWLVTPTGAPAVVDFQVARVLPRRGRLFRMLALEDVRHLLKHKRTYCAGSLTVRERRILAKPAATSRIWMAIAKPVYTFVTRRLLGWADREGAGNRRS